MKVGMGSETSHGNHSFAVAVIDGPYDTAALSGALANAPVNLTHGSCDVSPNSACEHGTFIMGLLGAHPNALIPGLCPDCPLIHIPLFTDVNAPSASVDELAAAINKALAAGARLINLSLAILGDESEFNPRLAAALDFAEASGALLVVAAGNQGCLAIGQLLSHPVVIPVVAVDASQRLLPESNFGPGISRRGVAALGRMPGYAPGGGTTVMSGTSVATAVATGILAQAWSAHPDIEGATLRSIVAGLSPRDGSKPPILSRDLVLAALDEMAPAAIAAPRAAEMTSSVSLQGVTTMANGNGQPAPTQGAGLVARPAQTVAPAGGVCGCGAPDGACTCNGADGYSGFVYAIGTIEADYPNVGIEREMQTLGVHFGVDPDPDGDPYTKPTEDRLWQYAVLSKDRKLTRYIARQLRWRMTIKDLPVFVLNPSDPSYFDDLIDALKRPKYAKTQRRVAKGKPATKTTEIDLPHGPPDDLDVVVGVAGPQTPGETPVLMDQIFQVSPSQLAPAGSEQLAQIVDNHGLTDGDRAYNFLVARYNNKAPLSQTGGFKLSGMRTVPSRLGAGIGRIVRVICTFTNADGVEKEHFARVDVTHEFPMIVTSWQPYLQRGEKS
ncbi:MAG: S8 family serine peptidase [Alphaproteobacteria bacterium]